MLATGPLPEFADEKWHFGGPLSTISPWYERMVDVLRTETMDGWMVLLGFLLLI